jgi:hypothetical protein
LIKCHELPEAAATWELLDEFREAYPAFQLEDEQFSQAGRDVMNDVSYKRRRASSG